MRYQFVILNLDKRERKRKRHRFFYYFTSPHMSFGSACSNCKTEVPESLDGLIDITWRNNKEFHDLIFTGSMLNPVLLSPEWKCNNNQYL